MNKLILATAAVLVLGACDRPASSLKYYAPSEAGRTLAYENPSLPQPQRSQDRLQIRVARSQPVEGRLLVTKTFTTQRNEMNVVFSYEGGGITMLGDPAAPPLVLLPKGFPNVAPWEERGVKFRVEGRAAMPDVGLKLPGGYNPIGVWIASEPADGKGPKRRTFYLENLGEIQSQELRGGQWVTMNQLVSFGFTDAPYDPKVNP